MANEDMMNIAIRVSLIVLAAVVVIFLISYYGNPQQKPKDNSEKKGVEKFNTSGPAAAAIQEEQRRSVSFSNPVVTKERVIDAPSTPYSGGAPVAQVVGPSNGPSEPMPMDAGGFEDYIAVDYSTSGQQQQNQLQQPMGNYPQDRTKPEDLLPRDAANSKWAQVAPAGQGDVKNQNFLTAGFHIGKDTIGVARKNPNLSIRAEPPCPKNLVSPWMNSSIEPDQYRRGFEIGSSA